MTKIDLSLAADVAGEADAVFQAARAQIREVLRSPDTLSDDDCRRILRRYAAGIGCNFVIWLAAGAMSCRSFEGRCATSENVYLEIRDDHPGMLRDFARMSAAEPETDDFRYAERHARQVQAEVSKMCGVFIVALVGTLENVSLDYIPWLGAISARLGNSDMRYIETHGEADIDHANQFKWALGKEAAHYDAPEPLIAAGVCAGVGFVSALLRPDGT